MTTAAPTAAEIADREQFSKLVTGNLSAVQASAEKWRAGVAALLTLIIGGSFAKGAGAFNDIGGTWQPIAVVALGYAGLVSAFIGFWYTLRAAAGDLVVQSRVSMVEVHGSVAAFEVAQAATAAAYLDKAKQWFIVAVGFLTIGSFLWTTAPKVKPDAPVVKVTPLTGDPYCGALKSADNQTFRVQVAGESAPRAAAFDTVKNITAANAC